MNISNIQREHFNEFFTNESLGSPLLHKRVAQTLLKMQDDFESVLDVGGGDGSFLGLLGEVKNRFSIDISEKAVEIMQQKGIDAKVVDVDEGILPYADGSMDAVICLEVLEHLASPDVLLSEINRVLSDDGIFVASVPNIYQPATLLLYFADIPPINSARYGHIHFRDFTKRVLRKALVNNGFLPVKFRGTYIFPFRDPFTSFLAKYFPRLSHHIISFSKKNKLAS